ncbi:L-lactate permease [Kushneria aurantia]|uniref:L-lactate permease n=1 Tax=Kushneria aurantia TaxID=504092 RepID=A0ABV6G1E4_9GAMM|nr:lactate permease LctP family transporter [Kushneria aurantia]
MWQQVYNPLGSVTLSALVAAIPVATFLLALTLFRLKGTNAALIALGVAVVTAAAVFGMPPTAIAGAALYGILNGLWPIGWIVLMAVWLYRIAVKSGKFEVIRGSIASVSRDQRIQVLLIAFCFGAFLEGAAGFGIPIAICSALLVELGFKPLRAAMLCLVANAASGAYGAIGIPIIVGAQQGGVTLDAMAVMLILIVQLSTLFVPALLVAILDGFRGLRETWPVVLMVGALFSISQSLVLYALGPWLVDIIPPVLAMAALAGFMRLWSPRHIYRESDAAEVADRQWGIAEVIRAWSPFYILTAMILLWSLPPFRALFAAGGPLAWTTLALPTPGLHQQVMALPPIVGEATPLAAVWNLNLVSAAGSAIALSALLTTAFTPSIGWRQSGEQLVQTWRELWKPIVMICLVMAVAYITNFAGASSAMGLALAQSGQLFPLFSPVIGWLGVFITGSVVNNNVLFANLQAVTAQQIGTTPALLVAANTAGGVMAKLISPQSIAIAAAAVGLVGNEADITRTTLRFSLALLLYTCVWTLLLSLLL